MISDQSIDGWLACIRERASASMPALISVLDTYIAEARHGRNYVDKYLTTLPRGAKILEVGAGSLLLSCQLVREGYAVTAIEPVGEGFSHFNQMQELVRQAAALEGCLPVVLDQPAEKLDTQSHFDFAFSINVMEHVDDVQKVIACVFRSLKPNASYIFTCPNYHFPYEPHFDMPTLFYKQLTAWFFRARIEHKENMPDPWGTWNSLNWINVPMICGAAKKLEDVHIRFNKGLLVSTFERVGYDQQFTQRRSPLMRAVIPILVRLKLHKLLGLIPATFQPIIDCKLTKLGRMRGTT